MPKSGALRTRSRTANLKKKEFAEREARTKKWIVESQTLALKLRQRDRTFHGLVHEFQLFQNQMLLDFRNSQDVRHPRDVGGIRESILRTFLTNNGLLPTRYAVSSNSVRAASTTGHVSNELDIMIYDYFDAISLMRRSDVYEVLPIESVFGAVQVKSRLNKREIKEAFENIGSFKLLERLDNQTQKATSEMPRETHSPFGLIFAYDSDLEWSEIVSEIKGCASENESYRWPNGIFILSKGHFLFGDESGAKIYSQEISSIKDVVMHGYPDRSNDALYSFYSILLRLIKGVEVSPPPINHYYHLPHVAGSYSYEFELKHFSEVSNCEKHGPFAKKFTSEKLTHIINWCENAKKINWIRAIDIAQGKKGDDWDAYRLQPDMIVVYNPDNRPFSEVLLIDSTYKMSDGSEKSIKSFAFDHINIIGKDLAIYMPIYYEIKNELIEPCPKCKSWGKYIQNNFPSNSHK